MKIEKYYDRLDADERFRLLIAALSRDDDEEYENLTTSAPRHTYSMRDAKVSEKLNASKTIVLRFSLALIEVVLTIDRLNDGRLLFLLHRDLQDEDPEDRIPPKLKDLEDRNFVQLKTMYESFASFCSTARLEPETLLGAWAKGAVPYLRRAQEMLSRRPESKADEETKKVLDHFYEDFGEVITAREN